MVCDYGQILSVRHAGRRPAGRNQSARLAAAEISRGGAINWAIWRGEQGDGRDRDPHDPATRRRSGPIAQHRLAIEPAETAAQLEPRLAEVGGRPGGPRWSTPSSAARWRPCRKTRPWPPRPGGCGRPTPPWLIGPSRPRWFGTRFGPWSPGRATTPWCRPSGPPLRLILGPVTEVDRPAATGAEAGSAAPAGTVLAAAGDCLIVAAGQGAVRLSLIQPSGKRPLPVAEFLRGYPVRPGESLGDET